MAQKKNNKVSVASIEKVMKEHFRGDPKTFDWYGVEIEYIENISMENMVALINEVVNSCFDKDGDYVPEFKDFLIRALVMQMYSNVRLPQDIKKQYDILFGSDLFDVLVQHIDQTQYSSIVFTIDAKLAYRSSADVVMTRKTLSELIAQFKSYGEQLNQISIEDLRSIAGAINAVDLDEEKLVDAVLHQSIGETIIEDKENNIISINGDDTSEDRD